MQAQCILKCLRGSTQGNKQRVCCVLTLKERAMLKRLRQPCHQAALPTLPQASWQRPASIRATGTASTPPRGLTEPVYKRRRPIVGNLPHGLVGSFSCTTSSQHIFFLLPGGYQGSFCCYQRAVNILAATAPSRQHELRPGVSAPEHRH